MTRLIIILLFWSSAAAAQVASSVPPAVQSCKPISDTSARLDCYDAAVSSPEDLTLKKIALEVLSSPAATVAVFAAFVALLSGIVGPGVQLWIGMRQTRAAQSSAAAAKISSDPTMLTAQNAGSREIARMRIAWMDKLRDTLAEYHSILMSVNETDRAAERRKLAELGTQLDLLLNRNDKIQKNIVGCRR
jgi:hypothetical protein